MEPKASRGGIIAVHNGENCHQCRQVTNKRYCNVACIFQIGLISVASSFSFRSLGIDVYIRLWFYKKLRSTSATDNLQLIFKIDQSHKLARFSRFFAGFVAIESLSWTDLEIWLAIYI